MERDDEGTGTNSASQQNGNARTPIACCTIGRASPANWRTPYSENDLMVMSGGAWSPNTGESCTKKPIKLQLYLLIPVIPVKIDRDEKDGGEK